MTNEEAKSCIGTIEMLRRLHGIMNVIDAGDFEKIIKVLSDISKYKDAYNKGWEDGAKASYEHLKMCEEEQEPKTEKVIKMRDATSEEQKSVDDYIKSISKPTGVNFEKLEQEPKTGHWRHYEGMLICSECGTEFYDDIMEYCGDDVPKWCPNCGCRMFEPQERSDKE